MWEDGAIEEWRRTSIRQHAEETWRGSWKLVGKESEEQGLGWNEPRALLPILLWRRSCPQAGKPSRVSTERAGVTLTRTWLCRRPGARC